MKVTTDACLFGAWLSRQVCMQLSHDWQPGRALDIGTGTGLLSLMLAQQCSISIDAIEIDGDAFEQAKENVAKSPWPGTVRVIQGDIKNFTVPELYDVVISNPPFYENELASPDAKKNTAHHSSELGLDDLFRITRAALTEHGAFYFLFPYKRKAAIEKLLAAHGLFIHEIVVVKQSVRHDPFRLMLCGGLQKTGAVKIAEIAIRDEQDQYTPVFTDLLKDYYLYL